MRNIWFEEYKTQQTESIYLNYIASIHRKYME